MSTVDSERAVAFADARSEALAGLVDYAGLFPPASLDMARAAAGYRRARSGEHAFMLGRFVCDAGRLEELAGVLVPTMQAGETPWRVVALLGTAPGPILSPADLTAVRDFSTVMGQAAAVDTVDVKLGPSAEADDIARLVTVAGSLGPVRPFFEVAPAAGQPVAVRAALGAVASVRDGWGMAIGAKLRCGGITADLFPDVAAVAEFIVTCRDLALPYKATAGLHHPFRHADPATGFHHHGFLNLLAASVLAAVHDLDGATVAAIVADEDPSSFRLSRRALGWRDLEAGTGDVRSARQSLFTGYGSCDFDEPADDLSRMGVLPVEALR